RSPLACRGGTHRGSPPDLRGAGAILGRPGPLGGRPAPAALRLPAGAPGGAIPPGMGASLAWGPRVEPGQAAGLEARPRGIDRALAIDRGRAAPGRGFVPGGSHRALPG